MANRLQYETSPYLLQHAENPVDWFPWGDEALAKAIEEDKPIIVSIGYSACHWCHVMERESFEKEAVARVMNERFVCIKVDREERPDVDSLYMDAVVALTGQGGWPMTVFLTPTGEPFLAIHLDADELLVHRRCDRGVLERLVLHHVTPVAGGVAD
ncbi:MAG: thioredoxin domain-containing protein, partial [Bacteroidetes bacterium]|nr:thioredoxin domain-containing protein [Fibrella sp.]